MKYFSLLIVVLFVSCSSKTEVSELPTENSIMPTYVLREASHKYRPNWIDDPQSEREKSTNKDSSYFSSRSEGNNLRLCQRSSSARASAQIARQISQFVKNTYGESSQDNGDAEVSKYLEESLAQEAQAFIIGAKESKKYWEKREYQKLLGAKKDQDIFVCHTLLKMSNKNISDALRNAKAKLLDGISNQEVKQKTKKAIEHAEEKFKNI